MICCGFFVVLHSYKLSFTCYLVKKIKCVFHMKIIGVKKFRTYFYIYKCEPVLNRSNISLQIHLFKKVHIKLKLKLSYSYIYSCLFCWFSIIFFLPAVLHFRIHPFRLYYYKICLNISSRSWDMHPPEYLIYTYFYTMTCEHRNGCCTSMRTWSLVHNNFPIYRHNITAISVLF